MSSAFHGFETAKSSIFSNRISLNITANNLANSATVGYTRQSVDVASSVANISGNRVTTGNVESLMGQGVNILGVGQTRDSFLDTRFRQEYTNVGYHSQTSAMLGSIEEALIDGYDITNESGLFGGMAQLYSALNDFVMEPTSDAQANVVMAAFQNITQVLKLMNSNLETVQTQYTEGLSLDVDKVNSIFQQIAIYNDAIVDDTITITNHDGSTYVPNELYDARNVLLDELSGYGDVTTTLNADGTIDVKFGEMLAVTGDTYEPLNLQTDKNGLVAVRWSSTGESISTTGGSLLASIQILNGRGLNVQNPGEEPVRGVLYYQDQIDTYARALAEIANSTIPETDIDGNVVTDGNGNTVYKKLLGAFDYETNAVYGDSSKVDASNICVSTEWNSGGPGYLIYDRDLVKEDYAQELATRLKEDDFTFVSNGETFVGTFDEFQIRFIGAVSTDLNEQESAFKLHGMLADDYLSQRDSVSGVSTDEETANMLQFQKSLNAASRMLTVFDDLLDQIINRMGRAGL